MRALRLTVPAILFAVISVGCIVQADTYSDQNPFSAPDTLQSSGNGPIELFGPTPVPTSGVSRPHTSTESRAEELLELVGTPTPEATATPVPPTATPEPTETPTPVAADPDDKKDNIPTSTPAR